MPISQIDALTIIWKARLTNVETREGELNTQRVACVAAMSNLDTARSLEQVAHKNLITVRNNIYGKSDPDGGPKGA